MILSCSILCACVCVRTHACVSVYVCAYVLFARNVCKLWTANPSARYRVDGGERLRVTRLPRSVFQRTWQEEPEEREERALTHLCKLLPNPRQKSDATRSVKRRFSSISSQFLTAPLEPAAGDPCIIRAPRLLEHPDGPRRIRQPPCSFVLLGGLIDPVLLKESIVF